MTTITTTCAGCGRALAVPDRFQGRNLKCPSCGHAFRVEAPKASPPPEPVVDARPPVAAPPPAHAAPFPAPAPGPPSEPFGQVAVAPPELPAGEPLPTEPVYWQVRRIRLLSAASMSAVVHAILGLLAGCAILIVPATRPAAFHKIHGLLLWALALLALPAASAVAGFVGAVVTAASYNLAARRIGGVWVLLE